MINRLALIHGAPVIPDGWACIYGERFSLADPQLIFLRTLETDYYYHLREIRTRYADRPGEDSSPSIEIFRDQGERAFQQGDLGVNAIDLRTISSPAGYQEGEGIGVGPMKPCIPLNMWFTPGCVLTIKISGYTPGGDNQLDLVVHGRYYLDPWKAV